MEEQILNSIGDPCDLKLEGVELTREHRKSTVVTTSELKQNIPDCLIACDRVRHYVNRAAPTKGT
jgi:hypothetical protein